MKYLYHGTTIEGMRNIITGRYDPDNTVWSCSSPGHMYAYDLEKWAECEGYTSNEYGDVDQIALKKLVLLELMNLPKLQMLSTLTLIV